MHWRVLYTRRDGGVSIICPSARCVDDLRWGRPLLTVYSRTRWGLHAYLLKKHPGEWLAFLLAGEIPTHVARDWEIHKFVRDTNWQHDRSDREQLAAKWIDSLTHGGLDELEAVALIGEFSAAPGAMALEIVDVSEIPADRTHRNAWRRSKNGGPIWIDEEAAVCIDEARMWQERERSAA